MGVACKTDSLCQLLRISTLFLEAGKKGRCVAASLRRREPLTVKAYSMVMLMSSYVERLLTVACLWTELNANLCWPSTSVELLALGYKWVNVTLCQLLLSSEACTLQLSWTVESEPAKPEVSGINSRRKPYITPHPFLKQALLKRRHMFLSRVTQQQNRRKFVAAPTLTLLERHTYVCPHRGILQILFVVSQRHLLYALPLGGVLATKRISCCDWLP